MEALHSVNHFRDEKYKQHLLYHTKGQIVVIICQTLTRILNTILHVNTKRNEKNDKNLITLVTKSKL